MGTLSEVIEFINSETVPSDHDMAVNYSYISKTPELMKTRTEYRKRLKAERLEEDAGQMNWMDGGGA